MHAGRHAGTGRQRQAGRHARTHARTSARKHTLTLTRTPVHTHRNKGKVRGGATYSSCSVLNCPMIKSFTSVASGVLRYVYQ